MNIVSWNVNGLRAVLRKGSFDWLLKAKPDIICLQETKCQSDQLPPEIASIPGYHCYYSWPKVKKGYSGVALFSKVKPEKVEYGMAQEDFDAEGRMIVAYFKDFVLINCYFPNGGGGPERLEFKLNFYDHFLHFITTLRKKGHNVMFCGDINTAHHEIDLARPKENEKNTGFLPVEREWMDQLVNNAFIDVYRHFHPTKKDVYTYWDMKTFARSRNVGWRIDYFFCAHNLISKIREIKILSTIEGSDHCPIELTLK